MVFSDGIFPYCLPDMLPSGTPEGPSHTLAQDTDMSTTSGQSGPGWRSVRPALFSPSPNVINPSPNSELQLQYAISQYNNSPFGVMHRAMPKPQEQTIRQQATPHQLKEQEHGFVSQTTLPSQILSWDHADFLASGGHYRSHQPCDLPSEILKCHWEGCRYTGTFGRKAELERHIRTQHINPKAYKCPKCGRPCNRNDNLNGHLRNVHGADTQVMQM